MIITMKHGKYNFMTLFSFDLAEKFELNIEALYIKNYHYE
ncbi:hypothetical protein RMAECT_0262 [Rickettsia rhipicephali str. Ect]|uniref:Uncharacterized protein n=1 Tax=Rickettsia rhipicephali str. Ect TaxID=1359199 RepID=A0A0F3PCX6_RICRH|nr:hypothetical protein RMAECT_0262 [Rickettsia rhipicephali str. Ect]